MNSFKSPFKRGGLKVRVSWKGFVYLILVSAACLLMVSAPFVMLFGFHWLLGNLHVLVLVSIAVSAVSCFLLVPCFCQAKDPEDAPSELAEVVSEVSSKAGLSVKPKLKVVDSQEVNAMAYYGPLGPKIALTSGLIQQYKLGKLQLDEVKAVIAHETAHLKAMHPLKASIATSIVSLTDVLSSVLIVGGTMFAIATARRSYFMLVIGLFSAILGIILKVASKIASIVSFHYLRSLEYEADAGGAELVGKEPMISMLRKVEELNAGVKAQEKLFMPERWTLPTTNRNWFERLFDTHPPTSKRIERLMRV